MKKKQEELFDLPPEEEAPEEVPEEVPPADPNTIDLESELPELQGTAQELEQQAQMAALPPAVRMNLPPAEMLAPVVDQMRQFMPIPEDCPDSVLHTVAQMAVAYRLNPFAGEIIPVSFGKAKDEQTGQWRPVYTAYITLAGRITLARRQSHFQYEARVMPPDEVKRYRQKAYDPADAGVEITLWRFDVAREAKEAGIEYKPTKAVGFWRKKAYLDRKKQEWKSDGVPETWTPIQVAEKRALAGALRKAYSLEDAMPSRPEVRVLEHQAELNAIEHMPRAERPLKRDEEGTLWA